MAPHATLRLRWVAGRLVVVGSRLGAYFAVGAVDESPLTRMSSLNRCKSKIILREAHAATARLSARAVAAYVYVRPRAPGRCRTTHGPSIKLSTPPWRRPMLSMNIGGAPRAPLQVLAVRLTRCTAALPWGDAQLAPWRDCDAAHGASFAWECAPHVFAPCAENGGEGVDDDGVVGVA